MKKKKKHETIFLVLFYLSTLMSGAIIGILVFKQVQDNKININAIVDYSSSSDISDYKQCKNLSLINTASCLENYVLTFYNYTIREDSYHSLEDVKENGGDCYDYSNLYVTMAESLGYKGKTTKITNTDKYAHQFAVIYDEKHYCILDQTFKPVCYTLGDV